MTKDLNFNLFAYKEGKVLARDPRYEKEAKIMQDVLDHMAETIDNHEHLSFVDILELAYFLEQLKTNVVTYLGVLEAIAQSDDYRPETNTRH